MLVFNNKVINNGLIQEQFPQQLPIYQFTLTRSQQKKKLIIINSITMQEEQALLQNNERPQKEGSGFRFLKFVDLQPYTIQLYYDKKHRYGTKTGGCISLIFYTISIIIFVVNIISFFKQTQLNYTYDDIKNDFQTPVKMDYYSFWVSLTGHDGEKYFSINSLNQKDYGLEVMAEKTNMINGSSSQEQSAQYCVGQELGLYTFPQSWKDNLILQGRSDVFINQQQEYSRLGMFIKITNVSLYQKLANMTVKVIMNLSVTHPSLPEFQEQKKLKVRVFYIRDGFPILENQLQELSLYFRNYWVITDENYLFPPWLFSKTPQKNYTHFNEQFTTMTTRREKLSDSDKDKIVWIKLKRSIYSTKFQRQYDKLPIFLSSSFSLIGVILFISMLLYGGYNKWAFLQRKVQKVDQKASKINIFKYIIFKIKNICRIFQSIKQDRTITQQFYQDLDMKNILRRITQLQQNQNVGSFHSSKKTKKLKPKSSFSQIS